jgi:hypothetical protein
MNIRVILLVLLVLVFAIGLGALSFISGSNMNLETAQSQGTVTITQNTPAGTVPHTVTVYNNNSNQVRADKGMILTCPSSQDLVVAEDKTIPPGKNETLKAYCVQPGEKATPGSQLSANQTASPEIIKIIDNSNPSEVVNATQSQLQIWTLVSTTEVNTNTGEAAALIKTQGITNNQLKQNLTQARQQVFTIFNLTNETLPSLNATNSTSEVKNMFETIINWISSAVGQK